MSEQEAFIHWSEGNYAALEESVSQDPTPAVTKPTVETAAEAAVLIAAEQIVQQWQRPDALGDWQGYQSKPRSFPASRNRREPVIVDGWDTPDLNRKSA